MKSRLGVWCALLAALLTAGVFALQASALSLTTVPITFPGLSLTGADQTATTSNGTWQADGEGDPAPWHVNVSSTDFDNGAGKTIAVSNFEIRLLDANIVVVSGPPNPRPSSTQTTFAALSGTDLKIVSATAAAGRNAWDITPDLRLAIGSESYAGNYSATVTVAIAVGP